MTPRPLALPDLCREVDRVDRRRGLDLDAIDGTGGDRWDAWRDDAQAACDGAERAGAPTWALALLEEVAEVMAERDPARLAEELVQVATVAMRWRRALESRRPR